MGTVLREPLSMSIAVLVASPLYPKVALRLEVGYRLREESVPSAVHAGSAPGVGQQAELSAWRSGPVPWGHLFTGTAGSLVAWCLFLCFVWHSVRKSADDTHPAVLNSLCLRGLHGGDSVREPSILGSI